jgi:hypothetical protein
MPRPNERAIGVHPRAGLGRDDPAGGASNGSIARPRDGRLRSGAGHFRAGARIVNAAIDRFGEKSRGWHRFSVNHAVKRDCLPLRPARSACTGGQGIEP